MPEKHQKNLEKIEKKIAETVENPAKFEDALKKYGPEISDLVERASYALKDISFSFQKLRVVISIGIEVYQLVDNMSDCIVSEAMTKEQQKAVKMELGKDLTYFIWMTVDPIAGYVRWLPFKKTIEKWLVRWLASYAMETAMDMLEARGISTFAVKSTITFRTLP